MASGIDRISDEQTGQTDAVLQLLQTAGATPRTAETWRQDAMTALVLGSANAPIAAMPISRRDIVVAPGDRHLRAGWISSNMFASRMTWRRTSRQTEERWPELLPEIDALLVVRRDAVSTAGRWYAACGFHPVLAIRCLYLELDRPPAARESRYKVQVVQPAGAAAWQEEMLAVYHDVYGQYGGARYRGPGFHLPALQQHYYGRHYEFQTIGLWDNATLIGYAVVGMSGWHSARPRMDILEIATRQWDVHSAQELIMATCDLAHRRQVRQVRAVVSVHDPYRPHFSKMGFEDHWGYQMLAKWLHPQKYLDKLMCHGPVDELARHSAVEITAAGLPLLKLGAPGGGAGPKRAVDLRGDAQSVTRLLLQRLEVASAVREGTLAAANASEGDIARMAVAFFWTPWVFHMLDYI